MAAAPEFPAWAVEEAARQLQITLRQLRQATGYPVFLHPAQRAEI